LHQPQGNVTLRDFAGRHGKAPYDFGSQIISNFRACNAEFTRPIEILFVAGNPCDEALTSESETAEKLDF
jgi:hypothetical protein